MRNLLHKLKLNAKSVLAALRRRTVNAPVPRAVVAVATIGMLVLGAVGSASADSTSENVTAMKDSIVETLAN